MTCVGIQSRLLENGIDLKLSRRQLLGTANIQSPVFFKLQKNEQSKALWKCDDDVPLCEGWAIGVFRYVCPRGKRKGDYMVHWLAVDEVRQTIALFLKTDSAGKFVVSEELRSVYVSCFSNSVAASCLE